MIRFVFRFLGLWILAAAFIFLIYDGTKSIAGGIVFITKLGQSWTDIHASSLQALQSVLENNISVPVWPYVVEPVLDQPTWLVLGIIAIILIVIGRKKKPLIGYARR